MGVREGIRAALLAAGAGLGLAATAATAQTISGEVTDGPGGAGMAGVPVRLTTTAGDPVGNAQLTGAGGSFRFANVPVGNYLIQEVTPAGFMQANATFPDVAPTAQGTASTFGSSAGNWNYSGNGGANPAPNFGATNLAPFESALNLTGPTVDLGKDVTINYADAQPTTLTNKGFQLQATFPGAAGSADSVTLNTLVHGVVTPETFDLANIHFHDPTENTINGAAPGVVEAHFVNVDPATKEDTVLAVFIKVGAANPALGQIFGDLAGLGTAPNSTTPGSGVGTLHLADLLPTDTQGDFYPGSLTTPPLSTPVNWFVFSTPIEMSQAQLNQYESFATAAGFSGTPGDPDNGRPTQDPAGRTFNNLTSVDLTADVPGLTGLDIVNSPVPEPSSWALMGLGLAGLAGRRWARRRRRRRPEPAA